MTTDVITAEAPGDRRLNAFRPDLADERLRGRVSAASFTAGRPAQVSVPVADMRSAPKSDAGLSTQLIAGDDVQVFDEADGWAWVQAERDGYVGYVQSSELGERQAEFTHLVSVPRTFVYPGPDLKFAVGRALSMGSRVNVIGAAETRNTRYALLDSGEAVIAAHLLPIETRAADCVAVAETLIHTPYLWGGTSGFGIDCSGLVQLAMRMAGVSVLRDTDMQMGSIGDPLDVGAGLSGLRRGDLVFWKGHVAMVTDPSTVIHASGHTMLVSLEGLHEAVERIGHLYGMPIACRRPPASQ